MHPTLIATSPNTFAYPSPIAGSIPIWYDPAYWYEGVRPKFVLGKQARATAHAVLDTLHVALYRAADPAGRPGRHAVALGAAGPRIASAQPSRAPAAASRSRPRRAWRGISGHTYLALPVIGILTYLPLHTEGRFIAGYVAMLAITWFMVACGWSPWRGTSRATIDRIAIATAVVAVITFVYAAIKPLDHVAVQLAGHEAPGTVDLRVARALTRAGVRSGNGIAFLGDAGGPPRAYYARLDRARVVGNINDPSGAFWRLTRAAQTSRLALLRARSGARVIVSDEASAQSAPGWVRVAGTGDAYRLLGGG